MFHSYQFTRMALATLASLIRHLMSAYDGLDWILRCPSP